MQRKTPSASIHTARRSATTARRAAARSGWGKQSRQNPSRGQLPQALESYTRALQAAVDPARRAVLKAEIGEAYLNEAGERVLAYLHAALGYERTLSSLAHI